MRLSNGQASRWSLVEKRLFPIDSLGSESICDNRELVDDLQRAKYPLVADLDSARA